jgi:hypothetical protein
MVYAKKSEPTLYLQLQPSQRLTRFLVAIYTMGLFASLLNGLPWGVRIAVFLGVLSHAVWLSKHIQPAAGTIQYNQQTGWQIGDESAVQILPTTVVNTQAIFLHYLANGKRRTLLIANDALSTEDFRRLLVALKISAKSSST